MHKDIMKESMGSGVQIQIFTDITGSAFWDNISINNITSRSMLMLATFKQNFIYSWDVDTISDIVSNLLILRFK